MLFAVYNSANMDGPPPAGLNWLDGAPFMPLHEYQEVLKEKEAAEIAADAADGGNIRRPRMCPRLEETFVPRIQMYARRVVRQDHLRQVMVNRCLELYPEIDRGRFRINERDVDFLLDDPNLDRPDADLPGNHDQVAQEPVHGHGLMVQFWRCFFRQFGGFLRGVVFAGLLFLWFRDGRLEFDFVDFFVPSHLFIDGTKK
jgi:hypothetical protein